MPITLKELKTAAARPGAKEHLKQLSKETNGRGLFHEFMEETDSPELRLKIAFLLEKAKVLEVDPNAIWLHRQSAKWQFAKWGNTPLHNGLAYENFQAIAWFLEEAKKNQIAIDLQAQDSSGKTPLLLSLKVVAPLELIAKLMTNENYHMADNDGMTPMMLACALRRTDVIALLIEQDANIKGYGPIDFKMITAEQKMQMASFINQTHEESGKSLGHFAVLRTGTIHDQKGENIAPLKAESQHMLKPSEIEIQKKKIRLAKQGCVLNLLKDAGMDGFRDESAQWNCVANKMRESISIACKLISDGQPCFVSDHAERDDGGNVYLNSKENVEKCLQRLSSCLEQPDIRDLHDHLKSLELSGTSLVERIMSRSEGTLTLLKDCGLNLDIQQHAGGKTVHTFIEGLKQNAAEVKLISELDKRYLFSLPPALLIQPRAEAFASVAASGLFAFPQELSASNSEVKCNRDAKVMDLGNCPPK